MNMSDDDFEKLRRELVFEEVSKAIKENPKNWASKLEELGFQWVDDEYDEEEVEENIAKPENLNQGSARKCPGAGCPGSHLHLSFGVDRRVGERGTPLSLTVSK